MTPSLTSKFLPVCDRLGVQPGQNLGVKLSLHAHLARALDRDPRWRALLRLLTAACGTSRHFTAPHQFGSYRRYSGHASEVGRVLIRRYWPKADKGRIEIPRCSRLLPYRDVLSFARSTEDTGVRRREFITLLGGGAVATWPIAARAQQAERMRRIGVLMGYAESDLDAQAWYAAFRAELQTLGWTEGRSTQIDTRWATPDDAESMRRFAMELVALQPDLLLSSSTPTTTALLQQTRHTIPIVFAMAADPVGSGFVDPPPLKWSDLRYVFDIQEDCNGKEAIQA
jgi:hypothetical protein